MCAKRQHTKHKKGAGRSCESLPALATLTELPPFGKLVYTPEQYDAYCQMKAAAISASEATEDEVCLGCVVRLDRGFPAVLSATELFRCEFSAALSKQKVQVAVGDWVCARRPSGHDKVQILGVCPRFSEVARWRGTKRAERQTLAANVNKVLIAQALGRERLSPSRIVRSAVVALDCNTTPFVVLTKADLCGGPEHLTQDIERLKASLPPHIDIVVTASKLDDPEVEKGLERAACDSGALWGIKGVLSLVPEGQIAIVLGESGAGKSTLLNALLGKDALETGAVRDRDGAGRHTTVARRMVNLERGGVIVDAPGLRSLPVLGHAKGLQKAFPAIAEAALSCKFRDCTHDHEPGCAVKEALSDGAFSQQQLDEYRLLAQEMRDNLESIDPDIVL